MNVAEWLRAAELRLKNAGIETARLDALLLLGDAIGRDRSHLLAHPELLLTQHQVTELENLLERRIQHEPLAYIRGKSEFYGREFAVNEHVLVPRPESETMIDLLKSYCERVQPLRIFDVGTGSGALAISAKLELADVEVIGVDIEPACLELAKDNVKKHSVEIEFFQSDLLSNLPVPNNESPITILANLPYVPDKYEINKAAKHEPGLALFGGPDGLDLYRTLFTQLAELRNPLITILTESLTFQHEPLATIAAEKGFTLKTHKDLIQVFQFSRV